MQAYTYVYVHTVCMCMHRHNSHILYQLIEDLCIYIHMGFGALGRFGAGAARSHVARHTGNDQLEPANVNKCLA